jgi:hypothetical protein
MPVPPIEDSASTSDKAILYGSDEDENTEPEDNEGEEKKPAKKASQAADSEGEDDEDEEEESDDVEDEEDDEEEPEEEKDEDLDKVVGAPFSGRPTYRQVVDKYPKIFKDFPGLRDVFFRERDYSRVFPTVEDAQESYDQLNTLKAGEQVISNGNPKDFLEILRDYDPNKEAHFVEEFLPSLYKSNKPAFEAITTPVIQYALRTMHRDAARNGNDNLTNSAVNVYEWLFGTEDIESGGKRQPLPRTQTGPDPEKENLKRERDQLLSTRHGEFIDGALNSASRKIDGIIKGALPEDVGQFEVKSITREVMDRLGAVLRADSAHRSNMDRLIRNGRNDAYSEAARERLSSAFLSRAKLALPEIIKKVKSEALRGGSKPKVPSRPNGSNSKMVSKVNKNKEDLNAKVKSGKISERAFLES